MARARSLRRNSTQCERIRWRELRNRNFANYKFRRQHPIDDYILDFSCAEAGLSIEFDGGGRSYFDKQQRDQVRENLHGVLQVIWSALEERKEAIYP